MELQFYPLSKSSSAHSDRDPAHRDRAVRTNPDSREEQVKFHELAPVLAKPELEKAGFQIVEVRDPLIERAPDRDVVGR